MKIAVIMSNQQVSFNIAGFTIIVNPKEVLESVETLREFIEDVIPARLTKDIDTTKLFNNLDKYLPLINKARKIFNLKGQLVFTINCTPQGQIYTSCNAQEIALDFHLVMEIIADIKELIEVDKETPQPSVSDSDKDYEDYLTNRAKGKEDEEPAESASDWCAKQAAALADEAEERESKSTSFHNGESNYVGKPAPAKPSRTIAEFKALLERNKFKTNR